MTLNAGTQLGRYEIRSQLGAGGMGEVYLAQDTRLERTVALKILPADVASDQQRMRRFIQEAKAASALNHPNIITIHEIEQIDSVNFIATEFIDGETLRERTRKAPLKLGEVLDVAVQSASALSAAHAAGIIHRDIKPENIMIRRDGVVKVLDFGLAKLTAHESATIDTEAPTKTLFKTDPGTVVGTVVYMSPEQARGRPVDARTDIFSLGVVLYEMVAGCLPFAGSTLSEVMASILSEKEPQPLARYSREVPSELERIVSKALRKNREERYQTTKDLLLDLKSLTRQLEFDIQLERSTPPQAKSEATAIEATDHVAATGAQAQVSTVQKSAAWTSEVERARTTSSAEYIVSQIKSHKRSAAITLAVLVLASVAAYFYFHRKPPLTEQDTILLADFVNTTGDAVFDGTLKQALAVALEQSPFLNIFSDQRVREALRLMSRSPDDLVTKDVAREICERQGLKAYLSGSISNLGSHYVITLEAVNGHTGDTLARQQVEAESKEQVLNALGQAATKLREKLGESLASIQKFDTPLEQATTSSLEALKAYSMGREQHLAGKRVEPIPFYKRAVELDSNFALAYARLSALYGNTGQQELSIEYGQKALELRGRVSERERLYISASFYQFATGEVDKAIEALEIYKRTYPRDSAPHNNVALQYLRIGQYEKAIEDAREAIRLNPNSPISYGNLGDALIGLNRFEEARNIFEQRPDSLVNRYRLYSIAFIQSDLAAMQQQIEWMKGNPEEWAAQSMQGGAAAFSGQLRKSREFSARALELAQRNNLKERLAGIASEDAMRDALFGNCQRAKEEAAKPLSFAVDRPPFGATIALALCGEAAKAQSLGEEMYKRFPNDTLLNVLTLPEIRAAIEIQRNNPEQAVQLLRAANRYEGAGQFWPEYLRGQAYLRLQKGSEAAVEFQKILDHRGYGPLSPLYPLAQLGLARAAALTGDTAKSRKAYEDFLTLWKDADADIPILIEAKKEYEKLK